MFINFDIFKRWLYAYIDKTAQSFGAAVTFVSTIAVTGAATLTGGISQVTAFGGAHNALPATAVSGTDSAFANGTQFLSSVWVPANITLTGVKYLLGSVGGTDRVYGVLYSAAGAVLANTTLVASGTTAGTAAQLQTIAFTATHAAVGPRQYLVGISANGATAKLRTVPAFCGGSIVCGTVAQVHGTVAAVVPPTAFSADTAPFLSLY